MTDATQDRAATHRPNRVSDAAEADIAAYLEHEPYPDAGNIREIIRTHEDAIPNNAAGVAAPRTGEIITSAPPSEAADAATRATHTEDPHLVKSAERPRLLDLFCGAGGAAKFVGGWLMEHLAKVAA